MYMYRIIENITHVFLTNWRSNASTKEKLDVVRIQISYCAKALLIKTDSNFKVLIEQEIRRKLRSLNLQNCPQDSYNTRKRIPAKEMANY